MPRFSARELEGLVHKQVNLQGGMGGTKKKRGGSRLPPWADPAALGGAPLRGPLAGAEPGGWGWCPAINPCCQL